MLDTLAMENKEYLSLKHVLNSQPLFMKLGMLLVSGTNTPGLIGTVTLMCYMTTLKMDTLTTLRKSTLQTSTPKELDMTIIVLCIITVTSLPERMGRTLYVLRTVTFPWDWQLN